MGDSTTIFSPIGRIRKESAANPRYIATEILHGAQATMGAFDIATGKIDMERQGAAMLTSDKMTASGYVNCSKDISREKGGENLERGDWNKEKNTMNASNHCLLTEDNLTISFTKDVTGVEAAVDDLSRQILEASKAGNLERIEELKAQMKNAVHGGDDDNNQLSIQVQIGINCVATAHKTHIYQNY